MRVILFAVVRALVLVAASSAPAPAASPEVRAVAIESFQFVPAKLEAHVGDVIEWTNKDFAPHSATADDQGWDIGLLKYMTSGRITVTKPGEVAYHCAAHPRMKGVITVLP